MLAYVSTNGHSSVTSGFSNIGGAGSIVHGPCLGQVLDFVTIGNPLIDSLKLGGGVSTFFAPNKNAELMQLELNWHFFKASKIGRVLAFDFNDIGLIAGCGAPVEWLKGKNIRGTQLVAQVGFSVHF